MPDQVWFAWYNNRADTQVNDKVRETSWARQRVHQYAKDQSLTFGGVTLNVDPNYLDLDGGHAVARQELFMSRSSFYRHLQKARDRLVERAG